MLNRPKAAYVHVPFCQHHCGYCNFTVVAGHDDWIDAYLEAVAWELRQLGEPQPIETLYLGGGSPSYLGEAPFGRLLRLLADWFPLVPSAAGQPEFTCEANPGEFTPDQAQLLASYGVTRVSLGVQSFRPEKLRQLDRVHRVDDIPRAIEAVRAIASDLALDLIFAAPCESPSEWIADLRMACAHQPEHISTYGLTFEKGTRFWNARQHGDLSEVDEELQRTMYLAAMDELSLAGYEHYEVSNFAHMGHRSRHNQVYWRGEEYFGIGPGAARYVAGVRGTNHRSVATYLRRVHAGQDPTAERESLTGEERARERLVFGLRMIEGVDEEAFQAATGFSVKDLAGHEIQRFIELGMLERQGARLRLTRDGLLVSDSLWPELL